MSQDGGASASASSVEAIFKPAFDEIARRKVVATSRSWDDTTYFSSSSTSTNLPFRLPQQHFTLLSMGTTVLAPVPVDATRPALRVYGAFATRDEAREHAEIIQSMDAGCSLMVVPLHEWALMPQNEESLDPETNIKRLNALLDVHRVRRMQDGDAFQNRIEKRDGGPVTTTQETTSDDDEETKEAEELVYKPPRKLRIGGEVRGQNYVAMCAIPNSLTGECIVKVLACFDTSQDADAWAQDVASRHIADDDILIGRTCEWLFPNGRAQSVCGPRYRIDELQRIMDAAERNPRAVQDYKTWKEQQDRCAEKNALDEVSSAEDVAFTNPPIGEHGDPNEGVPMEVA
jgi:hypothetical protein